MNRILVIEDEADIRQALLRLLARKRDRSRRHAPIKICARSIW